MKHFFLNRKEINWDKIDSEELGSQFLKEIIANWKKNMVSRI